jgi:hypothetical protein
LAWLLEQSGPWLGHRLTGNHQNRPISANHSAATRAGLVTSVTSLKAAEAPTVWCLIVLFWVESSTLSTTDVVYRCCTR